MLPPPPPPSPPNTLAYTVILSFYIQSGEHYNLSTLTYLDKLIIGYYSSLDKPNYFIQFYDEENNVKNRFEKIIKLQQFYFR